MPEIKTRKLDIILNNKLIKKDFEVPEFWNDVAATVAAEKYATNNENSAIEIINRVVDQITSWGTRQGYFNDSYYKDKNDMLQANYESYDFKRDLKDILINQRAAFNSPVWFNVGVKDQHSQISACFLGDIEDTMEDILEHTKRAGMIFKSGSGIGVNISKLRAEGELLSNKGKTSGPLSFMRAWDRTAQSIKSGGKNRRSAVLIGLDIDHPDIEEFIICKSKEERKAKLLMEAGISPDEAYATVDFQNANHSVIVTDDFMRAVEADEDWKLFNRGDGACSKVIKARDLFNQIATQAHSTGDPGIQFISEANKHNSLANRGRILSSNVCFAGDTKILTDLGYQRLDKLEGKQVNIVSPINSKIYKSKIWCSGEKPIYEVKFYNSHKLNSIKCTKNHRFMLIDGSECMAENLKGKQVMPYIEEFSPLNDDIILAGFIQGDGNTGRLQSKDHIGLEVNIGDKDKELLTFFNVPNNEFDKDRRWYSRRAYSIAKYYELSPEQLPNRELPQEILNSSSEKIGKFLCGLYSANGSIIKNTRVSLKSSCKKLVEGVQSLLKCHFNIESYITTNKPRKIKWHNGEYTSKESYEVNIHQWKSILLFAKNINFIHNYKRESLRDLIKYRTPKVTSVKYFSTEKVYDFSENIHHWGVIEGFVAHNCGEVFLPPWGACNLCSLNLIKYLNEDNSINCYQLQQDIDILITAMDIMIDVAYYPDERFKKEAKETRPLGLGITNLGAYLIKKELAYNSSEGRAAAREILEYIVGYAINKSILLAKERGAFSAFKENREPCIEHYLHIANQAGLQNKEFIDDLKKTGIRNSNLTCLAPTGTTALWMNAETFSLEPLYALSTTKKLSGGGTFTLIPKCVEEYINKLGIKYQYGKPNGEIEEFIKQVSPIKEIREKLEVIKTANEISWQDHIKMLATLQEILCMSASKTINMPSTATVEDFKNAYIMAWVRGLKGITAYRDTSKENQPLTDSSKKKEEVIPEKTWSATRLKLDPDCDSIRHKFDIAGFEGYIHVGLYENGQPGEIFIRASKNGSFVQALLDCFATSLSLGLQYGIPLENIVEKFKGQQFQPNGITSNEDIRMCTSIVDYIAKYLEKEFLGEEEIIEQQEEKISIIPTTNGTLEGPPCVDCGGLTMRIGSHGCWTCSVCGSTGGCS